MDPDERHDDFHDPSRWEADAEQAAVGAESSPDGGEGRQQHLAASAAAGQHRPSRAEVDERRARNALNETRGRVASSTIDPPLCTFCHGKPVGNAASWADGKARPPAACPRCGETNWPEDFEGALDALSRAALTPAPKDAA